MGKHKHKKANQPQSEQLEQNDKSLAELLVAEVEASTEGDAVEPAAEEAVVEAPAVDAGEENRPETSDCPPPPPAEEAVQPAPEPPAVEQPEPVKVEEPVVQAAPAPKAEEPVKPVEAPKVVETVTPAPKTFESVAPQSGRVIPSSMIRNRNGMRVVMFRGVHASVR